MRASQRPDDRGDCHILAHEISGPACDSPEDLLRFESVLAEIAVGTDTFLAANEAGKVITYPTPGRLVLLFLDDAMAPMRAALELSQTLQELPSLSVRMAIHSGQVALEAGPSGSVEPSGEGIETVIQLLEQSQVGKVAVSDTYSALIEEAASAAMSAPDQRAPAQRLLLLDPSGRLSLGAAEELESALTADGHHIDDDRKPERGTEWAQALEERIRSADTIIAIPSGEASEDELLEFQLGIAEDERRKRGFPQILPVWLSKGPRPDDPLAVLHRNLYHARWKGPQDNRSLIGDVRTVLEAGQMETDPKTIEANEGGTRDDPFYVRRSADDLFDAALEERESVILVKGPRQFGKTAMIDRGVTTVARRGWRCGSTDFRKLSSWQMASERAFYPVVAATLARQLGSSLDFVSMWRESISPKQNMDLFMRALLEETAEPLCWFLDAADRLFEAGFSSDFYALVRSWHNSRAIGRRGPWDRLTVVIGYATDPHLFIQDLHQSPFNVGRTIALKAFTLGQTREMNSQYGQPLEPDQVDRLFALVGGQPFLTHHALDLTSGGRMGFERLLAEALSGDGPFGTHLKRLLFSVTSLPEVRDTLVRSLSESQIRHTDGLHRLVAGGVLVQTAPDRYGLPCQLYRDYLSRELLV